MSRAGSRWIFTMSKGLCSRVPCTTARPYIPVDHSTGGRVEGLGPPLNLCLLPACDWERDTLCAVASGPTSNVSGVIAEGMVIFLLQAWLTAQGYESTILRSYGSMMWGFCKQASSFSLCISFLPGQNPTDLMAFAIPASLMKWVWGKLYKILLDLSHFEFSSCSRLVQKLFGAGCYLNLHFCMLQNEYPFQ